MPNEGSSQQFQIEFTPEFKRNVRHLAKKYCHIKSDLQPVLDALAAGDLVGKRIPKVNYAVYKVRAKNSDLKKGKSAGYRIIYALLSKTKIVLVTVYSKTEQGDISPAKIRQIIEKY